MDSLTTTTTFNGNHNHGLSDDTGSVSSSSTSSTERDTGPPVHDDATYRAMELEKLPGFLELTPENEFELSEAGSASIESPVSRVEDLSDQQRGSEEVSTRESRLFMRTEPASSPAASESADTGSRKRERDDGNEEGNGVDLFPSQTQKRQRVVVDARPHDNDVIDEDGPVYYKIPYPDLDMNTTVIDPVGEEHYAVNVGSDGGFRCNCGKGREYPSREREHTKLFYSHLRDQLKQFMCRFCQLRVCRRACVIKHIKKMHSV